VALLLPDGRGAVTLEDDAVGVDLLPEGERFTIPSGGKEPQTPAALSPDGRTLVVTEPEGALGLYDLEKRRRIGELRLDEGDGYVTGLAVSQGGDRIAATKGSVVELRSPKGALLAELEIGEEAVDALAFASDGRLATAGQDGIRIWSKAGKPLASLEGHHTRTGAAAFSPDGRHLVTGDIFGELMIWDLAKKRREAHFVAHRNVVTSIAFAPGTSTFVTGSWDGTALRWDLRTLVR
jgi:WD40 repeat protein